MRASFGVLAGVATFVAALTGSSRLFAAPASSPAASKQPSFFSPPRELALYGHIRSLAKRSSRFELRFDPACWLGGVTANRAAVEDKVIAPGDVVPNDYYIVRRATIEGKGLGASAARRAAEGLPRQMKRPLVDGGPQTVIVCNSLLQSARSSSLRAAFTEQ